MISVLCQNLCSWGADENAIQERTRRFRELTDLYLPDIIGVQEATPVWRDYLYNNMPEYDHIGLPRQEGPKGESCDIFWRRDRYTLLSGGTRWLSETPHIISKLEDSSHFRVFTWAVLKRKEDANAASSFLYQYVSVSFSSSFVSGRLFIFRQK